MYRLCYAVAAEEVVWDYAPTGYNNYDNTTLDEGNAAVFLTNTKALIGPKYKKAHYVEYTDGNFTTVKPSPEWLGNVGPIIRAEVHMLVTAQTTL
jgi:manganese oxidase